MPTNLREVRSFDAAVAMLGGTGKAARAIGKRPSQVCQWRNRYGQFPADLYYIVQRALKREGCAATRELFTFEPAE